MSTKHDGNDDLQQPEKSAADSWREKRKVRRRQREAEAEGITAAAADGDTSGLHAAAAAASSSGGGYVPYMSAAKRARMEREAALMEASGVDPSAMGADVEDGPSSSSDRVREAKARKALASLGSGGAKKSEGSDDEEKEEAVDRGAVKKSGDTDDEDDGANDEEAVTTLLEQAEALKQKREALSESERAALARKEEEERILREASQVQTNALQAASELAKGVSYHQLGVSSEDTGRGRRELEEDPGQVAHTGRGRRCSSSHPIVCRYEVPPADCRRSGQPQYQTSDADPDAGTARRPGRSGHGRHCLHRVRKESYVRVAAGDGLPRGGNSHAPCRWGGSRWHHPCAEPRVGAPNV